MGSTTLSNRETRSAAFRWFWSANFAIGIGGRAWILALPVLAIEYLSADARQVGYLAAAATVSHLLMALPAGVWIDRMSKRHAMIVSAVVRASLIGTVPLVWLCGWLTLPYLYVVALLVDVTSLFYMIAYQAYVPLLVGAKGSYRANALLQTSSRTVNAGSPAVIGFAMKFISVPALVLVDAIGYLACAAILTRVPEKEDKRAVGSNGSLRQELMAGFRFVWSEPALRAIAFAVVLSNFFATWITTLTPILVLETMRLGPANLGIVYTSAEVGGLVGALLLGQARLRFGIGMLLAGGLIMAAASTILIPLAGSLSADRSLLGQVMLMVSLFGTAVGGVIFAISQISLRQMLCPKELMSRVNASMRFIVWSTMPFASVVAGLGAHALGVAPTMWIAVLGTIATVLPILGISRHVPSEVRNAANAHG